ALWVKVLIGLVLGVIVGYIIHHPLANVLLSMGAIDSIEEYKTADYTRYLLPLGTIFINLVKMVIPPLIFFSLVSAITNMVNSSNMSKIGLKSVLAYLGTACFAVVIGLGAGIIFEPGKGVELHMEKSTFQIPTDGPKDFLEMIISIFPHNAIGAMAEGKILQIVVFSLFAGFTINLIRDKVPNLLVLINEFAQFSFKMIELIVKLSPIGVFGFMSWMIGEKGLAIVGSLGKLFSVVLVACFFQYLIFGLIIKFFGKVSPLPFYKKMIEPQTLAFSTSSSKAALATTMKTLKEKMGVSETSANFVLPLGASMNMDGTAIYLGICALFFAQATDVVLGMHDYVMLIFTCTIASIGAAGIPSGSIIFMGMVLNSVGIPIEYIAIILGIDRVLDMFRTTVNITGDACITLTIDSTEKQLDEKVYYSKS
ncbi:MAG: dicarboxylate/amino acid:cation symporter, partial [Rickettsiales bacterium]|nr:dicarboxylate/amino acid:cation symporter [Rickettsiales bacterium]